MKRLKDFLFRYPKFSYSILVNRLPKMALINRHPYFKLKVIKSIIHSNTTQNQPNWLHSHLNYSLSPYFFQNCQKYRFYINDDYEFLGHILEIKSSFKKFLYEHWLLVPENALRDGDVIQYRLGVLIIRLCFKDFKIFCG